MSSCHARQNREITVLIMRLPWIATESAYRSHSMYSCAGPGRNNSTKVIEQSLLLLVAL